MSPDRKTEVRKDSNILNLNRGLRILFTSTSIGTFIVFLDILTGDKILHNPQPDVSVTIGLISATVLSFYMGEICHRNVKKLETP